MIIEVSEKREIRVSPESLAMAFWAMSDHQQADFFDALAAEVRKTAKSPYDYGENQWVYMASELRRRNGHGLQMYNALSVFAFELFQQHGLQMKAMP